MQNWVIYCKVRIRKFFLGHAIHLGLLQPSNLGRHGLKNLTCLVCLGITERIPRPLLLAAYSAASSRSCDLVIIDTAGRLHVKENLMDELFKLKRVLAKNSFAPHHAWLVVDGSTGTNGLEQAKVFNEKFGLTGLVVTKLDGTSKGGVLVSIYRELKLPIYYVGLGESPEDLQPFSIDWYLDSILPVGELVEG